ncbi:MAG: O-antigen ligase family protein [Acidobacteriota bacterium]
MQIIAIIPGLIALYVALAKSPAKAFLYVYLPTLFLLPDYYRLILAGFPDPTFNEAAILPIAAAYVLKDQVKWKFSVTDLLVTGLAVCIGYSQYLATGYNDAQNLIFDTLCLIILPYALSKGLIEQHGLRVKVAKMFILILLVVVVAEAYEFRFALNPFRRLFDPFFPGDMGRGWITVVRYGFGRAAGPYGHPILCGIILATGFFIQRWLERGKHWKSQKQARWITIAMVIGSLMTISRGPWIGAAIGSVVTAIGYARNRGKALVLVLVIGVVVGIPAYLGFQSYVSVGREGATSATQETAAYRKELFDKYLKIAQEKAAWGWGQNTWPPVPGLPSIDNHFLNLALRHGFIALGFFCVIILAVTWRLGSYCIRSPRNAPGNSLAFTLLAAQVAITISLATVFMGLQAEPLFFILCGWADALVATEVAQQEPLFQFRRVLA